MISAIQWVPKGASKYTPERFVASSAEMDMMRALEDKEDDMEEDDSEQDQLVDGLPASFKMDEYDQEENTEDLDDEDIIMETTDQEEVDVAEPEVEDDDYIESEDEDDLRIRDTDGIVVVANTEEEFSTLEVQVYDEEEGNLYVHHEIALPALPLCLSWMNLRPGAPATDPKGFGSFIAVGTFKPGIEIWNLDVLDALEPTAVLGGDSDSSLRNVALPNDKQTQGLEENSHTDAVMCLEWNSSHRQMLLSGSADTTVKLWDISVLQCMQTYTHHSDKVQCVAWNPVETTIFASASFDKTVVVLDGRNPDAISKVSIDSDPESLVWNPHQPEMLLVSQEDGKVRAYDVRKFTSPLFCIQAHDKVVSAISCSTKIPGLFATASSDKTVKIWDMSSATKPTCVTSKTMQVGDLYSMSFYQDSPYTLAVGGADGILALWDTSENEAVERKFAARIAQNDTVVNEIGSSLKTPEEHAQQLLAETSISEKKVKKKSKKSKTKK